MRAGFLAHPILCAAFHKTKPVLATGLSEVCERTRVTETTVIARIIIGRFPKNIRRLSVASVSVDFKI
jgi:hypothetical protein